MCLVLDQVLCTRARVDNNATGIGEGFARETSRRVYEGRSGDSAEYSNG